MPNTLRTIFFFGAAALSATSTAATPAAAQSFFCPATIAGLTGIHFAVNECTNGSTGAYSNATLAAQAVSDLSQSSTQDATKATMTGLSNRRAAEQDRCPEGFSRIGGVCQRSTIQATPYAAESPLRGALLPAELQAAAPSLQASAAERMPVATWVELHGDYELRTGRGQGSGEFGPLALDARSATRSGGLVSGVDVTLRNIASPGDGFIIGILTGYMSSDLTVDTRSVSADPARIPGGSNALNVRFTGPSAGSMPATSTAGSPAIWRSRPTSSTSISRSPSCSVSEPIPHWASPRRWRHFPAADPPGSTTTRWSET